MISVLSPCNNRRLYNFRTQNKKGFQSDYIPESRIANWQAPRASLRSGNFFWDTQYVFIFFDMKLVRQ